MERDGKALRKESLAAAAHDKRPSRKVGRAGRHPIHGAKQSVNAYKLYTYHRKKSDRIYRNICEFPHLPTA